MDHAGMASGHTGQGSLEGRRGSLSEDGLGVGAVVLAHELPVTSRHVADHFINSDEAIAVEVAESSHGLKERNIEFIARGLASLAGSEGDNVFRKFDLVELGPDKPARSAGADRDDDGTRETAEGGFQVAPDDGIARRQVRAPFALRGAAVGAPVDKDQVARAGPLVDPRSSCMTAFRVAAPPFRVTTSMARKRFAPWERKTSAKLSGA
jgi:hypothetical protein